jgi:hypothetical protein
MAQVKLRHNRAGRAGAVSAIGFCYRRRRETEAFVNISYLALTPDNHRLATNCITLDEALSLAAAHLAQNVLPVSIVIEGRHFNIDMILALLDQKFARQARE